MIKRKVCVVTGSRAEYGILFPVLKEIQRDERLALQLVATTMHLSDEFGSTYRQIEKDGFTIDEKIDNLVTPHSDLSMPKSSGMATMLLADSFKKLKPNIVLLLGDRFETHAAATTALLMNIPIAHIHGGEITQGAVDEQLRHSISKMSYLHFCSTEIHKKRIIQMGEEGWRVFNVGSPSIDNIVNIDLLSRDDLSKQIGWSLPKKYALFTYHPTTLVKCDLRSDLQRIFDTLSAESGMGALFTYANADSGGVIINNMIEEFCMMNPKRFHVVKNLGQLRYLSAMKHSDLLIGNTSSGIIEAASFFKPVVNIGERQKGRLRSENVIDCTIDNMHQAIVRALSVRFKSQCQSCQNIYGSGDASKRIIQELACQSLSTVKKFIDIE